jgi:hypothetical protein
MFEEQLKQRLYNYYIEFKSIQFTADRISWLLDNQKDIESMYSVNVDNIINILRSK